MLIEDGGSAGLPFASGTQLHPGKIFDVPAEDLEAERKLMELLPLKAERSRCGELVDSGVECI
jgi:hypothetical protein